MCSSDLHYQKIGDTESGRKMLDNYHQLKDYDLSVVVVNFVDMLSHARTEMKMIRELISDESSYRSLTLSWFQHSPLFELLRRLANDQVKVVVTTDHGTIRVQNAIKVVGDRNTNTNLRYKQGKNLGFANQISGIACIGIPQIYYSTRLEKIYQHHPNQQTHQ